MGKTKRPWPYGERSPWSSDANPPTVLAAAWMYPVRAVRNAICGLIVGSITAASIALLDKVTVGVGVHLFEAVVFLVVTPAYWWWTTSAEVRGHIVITGGDGD